ncbi:hypothetical protein BsWGS_18780 [Bradybaena similaris]
MLDPPSLDMDTNMVFSHKGSNPDNGVTVDTLPNLPELRDISMPNKSDAGTATVSQMNNWTKKSIKKWKKNDTLDFAFWVLDQKQLDGSMFKGEAYSKFDGGDLCAMDRDAFERIDSSYGAVIYDCLQSLLQQESVKNETGPPDSQHTVSEVFNANFTDECWVDENNNINKTPMDEEPCQQRVVNEACDNRNIYCEPDLRVLRSGEDIKVVFPSLGVYSIGQEFELPSPNYNYSTSLSQSSTPLQQRSPASLPLKLSSMPMFGQLSATPYVDSVSTAGLHPKFGELRSLSTSQYARSPSTSQYTRSPSTSQCTRFPSTSQCTRSPSTLQHTRSPSNSQYMQSPSPPQYTRSPSTSQYTRSLSNSKYTRSPSPSQYTRSPSTSQYTRSPSTSQYTRSPSTSQYTSIQSSKSASRSLDFLLFPCFPATSPTSACSPSCSMTPPSCSMTPLALRADSNDLGYSSDDSSCSLSFMPPIASPQREAAFLSDDIQVGINDSSQQTAQRSANKAGQNNDRGQKAVAAKNGYQLWKFVLELLQDPEANPRLLKWEDRNSGVFRFVQSEKVAQLWGKKKNNPQMTYEKMSRAMRFCRSIGYFSEIEKNGRFPKKLCFKFGIKSYGWRD